MEPPALRPERFGHGVDECSDVVFCRALELGHALRGRHSRVS